jgi:hypothetical protein
MTKRETDTSASEEPSGNRVTRTDDGATRPDDPEALFDTLVEERVLAVGETGVRTTDEFDDTHAVYHDSYVGVDETEFHEAVAATFGLSDRHAAAELVAERGVSRAEFITYLAVESHVNDDGSAEDLAAMAGMVSEVVPDSPVPAELADVTDAPAALLETEERVLVSVWKRFCDPCEATKADLDTILDATPDDAALAGIDGEVAIEFCEAHAVESAPGFVLADGDDRRTVCDSDAETVSDAVVRFYRE